MPELHQLSTYSRVANITDCQMVLAAEAGRAGHRRKPKQAQIGQATGRSAGASRKEATRQSCRGQQESGHQAKLRDDESREYRPAAAGCTPAAGNGNGHGCSAAQRRKQRIPAGCCRMHASSG
jgi:hypothetical protein